MSGFLDKLAPSIDAEYFRYVSGDILGKLISKNFFLNRIGYSEEEIVIPLSRYGDANSKYSQSGIAYEELGDGHIQTPQRRITFEIKCAQVNIANRYLAHSKEGARNWAFANALRSPAKIEKKYDVLIAIGLQTLGLEDPRYWTHFAKICDQHAAAGRRIATTTRANEPEFLSICTFFIFRREQVKSNSFRINLDREHAHSEPFQAAGYDAAECRRVWNNATNVHS